MKHEWRKAEKNYYLPKTQPEIIEIPAFQFFSIKGQGNPGNDFFAEYISVLYSLSYAVKMSQKQGLAPVNYQEYAVYPLEGVWDITEEARKNFTGIIDKDQLIFDLMIRQPDFVTPKFAADIIEKTKKKKPHPLLEDVRFASSTEGTCVQMLHLGSYNNEPESFSRMEEFATSQGLRRKSKIHREIYLSDARKTEPAKLKTVLRFQVD